MADERWTAETEELVARAEYTTDMTAEESDDFEPIEWTQVLPFVREAYLERARAGLTALADAGVLIPAGGVTRQEFGYRYRGFKRQWTKVLPSSRERAARDAEDFRTTFAKTGAESQVVVRDVIEGPWREVTDDDPT